MKKTRNFKEFKGITLIALVVTIVVMLILAGISIYLTLENSGILKKAKIAKQEYLNAEASEREKIKELEEKFAEMNKNLPENTADTEAGTPVKIPNEWYTTTCAFVSTEDGSTVQKAVKVASVIAVATGNGETVPVPSGFFYVGGNKSTGIVISDREEDSFEKNKKDMSVNSEAENLKGNQFVWIPCTIDGANSTLKYEKSDFGMKNTNYERTITGQEEYQVKKYGGFYVGRYEAGLGASNVSDNIKKAGVSVSKSTFSSWHSDIFNLEGNNLTALSKPTSIKGDIPWYHVDYYTSAEISKRMYESSLSVTSGLLTGAMWDTMIKYMTTEAEYKGLTGTTAWGNYTNQNLTDCTGMYCNVTSGGVTSNWTENTEGTNAKRGTNSYAILSTGASNSASRMKIYDVAGNLWEWTNEQAWNSGLSISNTDKDYNAYAQRGGSCCYTYASLPACSRTSVYAGYTRTDNGFRVALFIK